MKCYKHYNRDASSQCLDCGKALCPECTNKYNYPLCDTCFINEINSEKLSILKILGLSIFIFIGTFYYKFIILREFVEFDSSVVLYFLWVSYGFSSVPIGWVTLTKLQPNSFIWMPIIGWLFYFIIKLYLSVLIGIFIFPYKIYKFIKRLIEIKNLKKRVVRKL
ncbi:hypothetical protein GM661_00625 [Iocasia frigidifontis]|uniref:B box-type domain-containing protein n=1 Tax=Iocasia fonsfrigidae TaxID=2682810 RepID=A0A8A7KAM0_9FIRM|nr:hypothetical protein [Iocasia fonsfrigidae]QTL96578.1 hypothetical protein GM661_00625 [Iocasia fonsfrigidae]